MTPGDTHLATLVGSRLCHDLISPIGAIQNGLELLSLSGHDSSGPEMALIRESCDNATARILFFRVAFGSAGSSQMMGRRDILSTFDGLLADSKHRADWRIEADLPRSDVQLGFLAFLCCETALPQGGTVRFDRDAAGWSIEARGPRLKHDPPLWDHLNGAAPLSRPTADRVHFALLAVLAEAREQKLLATLRDEVLTIKIA
jgi:histidine phosphotransferase ChpT